MNLKRPLTLGALALACLISACGKKGGSSEPPAASSPGQVSAPSASTPLSYHQTSAYSETGLTLPEGLKAAPDLMADLYAEGVRELQSFDESSKGDRAETEEDGNKEPLYFRKIAWRLDAETSKLLSLKRLDGEFTGGAHPNANLAGLIYDKSLKREIQPQALFQSHADLSAADQALCAAIAQARSKRNGQASAPASDAWKCPQIKDAHFILTPSTTPGKAGGATFLFSPYEIGPYSEGAYEVVLPQSLFHAALKPEYADEFAGDPKPAPEAAFPQDSPPASAPATKPG